MRDIAGQALAFVQDLVTALLNFHTYTEQRIQIFPVDSAIDTISPLNQKVNLTQDIFCLPGYQAGKLNIYFYTTLCISKVLWKAESVGHSLSPSR